MERANPDSELLVSADFHDVDLLCSTVKGWNLEFAPLTSPQKKGHIGHFSHIKCGEFLLGRTQFSVSLEQKGCSPADCYTFAIIEKSFHHLWWRGMDLDCNEVIVYPPGIEVFCTSGSEWAVHIFSIPEATCTRLLADLRMDEIPLSKLPMNFHLFPRDADVLRAKMRTLSNPLGSPALADVAGMAEELIVQWVSSVTTLPDRRPKLRRREHAVHKSLEYLDRDDWFGITPSELCFHSQVSERTLQYAFKERFGLTPAAFLKARKLAAARHELKLDDTHPGMIGEVAAKYGFWQSGHFAADYRNLFGELPQETLGQPVAR